MAKNVKKTQKDQNDNEIKFSQLQLFLKRSLLNINKIMDKKSCKKKKQN